MKPIYRTLKETDTWEEKPVRLFPKEDVLEIYHGDDLVMIDKAQAKDLQKVLKEFLDE